MKIYFCADCTSIIGADNPEDAGGTMCMNCGTLCDVAGTIVGEFSDEDAQILMKYGQFQ